MIIKKEIKKLKIKKNYIHFVNEFILRIREIIQNKLHSIYICGSIANGKAKPYISDADFTIVVEHRLNKSDSMLVEKIKAGLLIKYPILIKIDTPVCTVADVLDNPYDWGFWIKIICYCIYGIDLGSQVPIIKPSRELVIGLNTDTHKVMEQKINEIKMTNDNRIQELNCKKIAQRLMRAIFTLIIYKEKTWTNNLSKIEKLVIRSYPAKKRMITTLSALCKSPMCDRDYILSVINEVYEWFKKEFEYITNQEISSLK